MIITDLTTVDGPATGPNDEELKIAVDQHEANSRAGFQRDLAVLINRYSRENGSNTPDFLLANYLMQCLDVWNDATHQRDKWYGKGRST